MTLRRSRVPPPSLPQPQTTTLLIPSHLCTSLSMGIRWRESEREEEIPRAVVLALTCASPPRWSSSLWLHLIRTLALHGRALLHGHTCGGGRGEEGRTDQEVSLPICQPRKARRSARDESFPPGPKRRRLAHLLASPALPGHSSQPLSNRRAGEAGVRGRGWGGARGREGRRCLKDWSGHGTASRAPPPRMSLCSHWTCYS